MTDELARRAVACPRWRWMPGMLAWCPSPRSLEEYDWTAEDCGGSRWTDRRYVRLAVKQPGMMLALGKRTKGDPAVWIEGAWFPDLDDAATKGCLLALVRQLWDAPCLHIRPESGPSGAMIWRAWNGAPLVDGAGCDIIGATEEEALVNALMGAP